MFGNYFQLSDVYNNQWRSISAAGNTYIIEIMSKYCKIRNLREGLIFVTKRVQQTRENSFSGIY